MRRALRWIGISLGGLVGVAVVAAGVLYVLSARKLSAAPVVPIAWASTAPVPSKIVLAPGVPPNAPSIRVPPEITYKAASRQMKEV